MKEIKDFKFIIVILLTFFGAGVMAEIEAHDYDVNNTGIMYQENDNIVLNENNRYYDYDIDFNLNESYLHYSPVKKGGLLDSLYNDKSKNEGVPDLTGKEYLGDGLYRLYNNNSVILDYNVYNGVFTTKKTEAVGIPAITLFNIDTTQDIRVKITLVENNNPITTFPVINQNSNNSWQRDFSILREEDREARITTSNSIFRLAYDSNIYDTIKFKLQIEKGDTATPYQVPYTPGMIIDFKGSNQVEYINPYEEQVIKIDDIKNVNNIEFELLNTKNSVVYNWNIKTNENMPFVRFYNNQTKLIYDFTDVKQMNNIGDRLLLSQTYFTPVIRNVLDFVNFMYKGFQRLFNKKTIDSIFDSLKIAWPKLPPTLPLLWR